MQWMTTRQAASDLQLDISAIQRAAVSGELHGHQRYTRDGEPLRQSRWRFHPDAFAVYVRGGDVDAQRRACGCDALDVRPANGRSGRRRLTGVPS